MSPEQAQTVLPIPSPLSLAGEDRGEGSALFPPLPLAGEGRGEGSALFPPLPQAGEGLGEGQPCESCLYNHPVAALLWFWLMAGSALLLPAGRPAPALEGT